jgi:hypothetical protein
MSYKQQASRIEARQNTQHTAVCVNPLDGFSGAKLMTTTYGLHHLLKALRNFDSEVEAWEASLHARLKEVLDRALYSEEEARSSKEHVNIPLLTDVVEDKSITNDRGIPSLGFKLDL